RVPVVARGAGTSLTGAVVLDGAIILDMQRFNRILRIDPVNWYVQVQAGVVLDDLNEALRKEGFFFPPDPASSFLCTVGGAIEELRRRQVMANLMEFMDRETVLAVNAAYHTHFEEAEATLLVDLDEPLVDVAEAIFRAHGARRFSRAANEAEAERFYSVRS